jgi:hypothetical protein
MLPSLLVLDNPPFWPFLMDPLPRCRPIHAAHNTSTPFNVPGFPAWYAPNGGTRRSDFEPESTTNFPAYQLAGAPDRFPRRNRRHRAAEARRIIRSRADRKVEMLPIGNTVA